MWTDRLLAVPAMQAPSPFRVMTLFASGSSAMWQGNQDIALEKVTESLAIVQQSENKEFLPFMLMGKAVVLINMGRDSEAQPMLYQAQVSFKEMQVANFHAITLIHLGNAELGLGHIEQARAYHEEALVQARAINENWIISFALNNLGEVARTQGQFDLARKYYEECEILLRTTGDKGDVARFVHNLGYIAQHEEDFELAESQFRKSLRMFRQLGNRRGMAECMAGLAGLKAQQGQVEWGAVLLTAAENLLKISGGAWWPADRVEVERSQEMIRSALGEAEWTAAQKKGAAMSLEQALAFASES